MTERERAREHLIELGEAKEAMQKADTDAMAAETLAASLRQKYHALSILVQQDQARGLTPKDAIPPAVTDPSDVKEDATNLVDWIYKAVADSGKLGIIPPDVFRKAEKAGIKMHPNYPYIVLKKLVARGRVIKRGSRYSEREAQK
jgi:hypothetical protein